MAEYWAGDARWTYLRKNVSGVNSVQLFGNMVNVMPDGTWYMFNRLYIYPGVPGCGGPLDIQIRKSTDKGATWSAPVTVIQHTAGTPWSCMASDGDAYYNASENRWHYRLFKRLERGGKLQEFILLKSQKMGSLTQR